VGIIEELVNITGDRKDAIVPIMPDKYAMNFFDQDRARHQLPS
jgi:hypothetical protein